MPSLMHETMIEMVRHRPAVVADFLSGPMGLDVPTFRQAMFLSSDLTEVTPTEYRADGVVAFYATDGAPQPSMAVVFEAQRRLDWKKRLSWPVYVATAHARHDCPTALLVWCENESVAKWAAEPISTGDPGLVLTPIALGPDRIPVLADAATAKRCPELTVLSTIAHGPDAEDPEPLLRAFVGVLDMFDPEHAQLYAHLVASALSAAARGILEKMMTSLRISHEEFARTVLPETYARLTAQGKVEGRAEALLAVLHARSVAVSDEVRERITSCADVEQLDAWIVRAATAMQADELFV